MARRFLFTGSDHASELAEDGTQVDTESIDARRERVPLFEDSNYGVMSMGPIESLVHNPAQEDPWELELAFR
jgi:hypothetical protein